MVLFQAITKACIHIPSEDGPPYHGSVKKLPKRLLGRKNGRWLPIIQEILASQIKFPTLPKHFAYLTVEHPEGWRIRLQLKFFRITLCNGEPLTSLPVYRKIKGPLAPGLIAYVQESAMGSHEWLGAQYPIVRGLDVQPAIGNS